MEIVNRKKILFIVTQSEFGGAQRYIFEVARSLDPERYKILVAAGSGDGELFQKLKNTRVQSMFLKQMKRAPWQFFLAIGEIYNLLRKERPDVLFLCSTTAGLLGSVAALLYRDRLSVIYRIGGWAFRDPRPWLLNQVIFFAEKLTARFKDIIVVNSEYDWRIAVRKKIISPEKIVKIYNGLDVDSLDFLPKEKARDALNLNGLGLRLVGCVANFYKTKGLEYLITAAKEIDAQFVIIGEGRLRPKLKALIKRCNLENRVILAGRIPDACKYLKAFDVFVLPSLKEGFPWIVLEAMAAELPIVATNVGALPEAIEEGKEGFLVKPKDSNVLAEKIKWLLENPQEAKVLGIQAKVKLVKEFSLRRMVQETEKLIS